MINTIPIEQISDIKVGDFVFYNEKLPSSGRYKHVNTKYKTHPNFPLGYMVKSIHGVYITVQSHSDDQETWEGNYCCFCKVIQGQGDEYSNFGYRDGLYV